jgi:predicted TIM-barrel fold metal-dependent hydrolase
MEHLVKISKLLVKYEINIRSLTMFQDHLCLINSEGTPALIPYPIIDTADEESLARLILFSLDRYRASSPYWKYEDWDSLEIELENT